MTGRWRRYPPVRSPISAHDLSVALLSRQDAPEVFRALLADRYAASAVALCASGTDALTLALSAVRERAPEAAIALPAFGCFAIASSAVAARVRVVLYDLAPDTLGPDWDAMARVLSTNVSAVVVAPQYGVPVDWGRLSALAASRDLLVIEDAAQAHGAEWMGRPVGSLGDLSVLSFGRGKGWTGGAGGVLLARGKGAELKLSRLLPSGVGARVLLAAGLQWSLARPSLYRVPASIPWLGLGETRYQVAGAPADITHFAARLALRTDAQSREQVAVRRERGAFFAEQLANAPGIGLVTVPADARPGWIRYPIRRRGGMGDGIRARRLRALGVAPSFPTPLGMLRALAPFVNQPTTAWPGADDLAASLITLPTHDMLAARDRDELLEQLATER